MSRQPRRLSWAGGGAGGGGLATRPPERNWVRWRRADRERRRRHGWQRNGGGGGGGGYPHGGGGSAGGTGTAAGNGTGGGLRRRSERLRRFGCCDDHRRRRCWRSRRNERQHYRRDRWYRIRTTRWGGITSSPRSPSPTTRACGRQHADLHCHGDSPQWRSTPTGAMGWAITPPGGGSTPCSSTTGPTGSSNVATYTCSISSAADGNYSATANYPGDSTYSPASGSDPTAPVYTFPTFVGVGAATTWITTAAKSVAYPSGAASGDLLLLTIAISDNTTTWPVPRGWTQSGTTSTATGANAYLESCYEFMTTDTSVSLTPPSPMWPMDGQLKWPPFRDVNATTPLDSVTPVFSVSSVREHHVRPDRPDDQHRRRPRPVDCHGE